MKGNRRRDTRPEIQVRSLLHRRGRRFRTDFLIREDGVRVRPDIVFPRKRLAVFIDGCFWHQCPQHSHVPRTNTAYWPEKLARTVERDSRVTRLLETAGWRVIRIWEHVAADKAVQLVEQALQELGEPRRNVRADP
jgi:DNA mismatch endonuclease, patch repair protein